MVESYLLILRKSTRVTGAAFPKVCSLVHESLKMLLKKKKKNLSSKCWGNIIHNYMYF